MPETLDPTHKPEITWRRQLERLGNEWRRTGRGRHWWIRENIFQHKVSTFQSNVPAVQLFTSEVISARRKLLREQLEQSFITRSRQGLKLSWMRRVFSRRLDTNDRIKAEYIRQWRSADYERQRAIHARQLSAIDLSPIDVLFSPGERSALLYRYTRPLRRQFIKQQHDLLFKFRSYDSLIADLPADPLDDQLKQLEDDYNYLGRGREWCREFEKLVDSVLGDRWQQSDGVNESRIRLMQNDFLLTMQGRAPAYWRYFQLRNRCFTEGISEMVTRFSYFEQELIASHLDGVDTAECFSRFETFTRKAQNILTNERRRQRNRRQIDHGQRMVEWDLLRSKFDEPIDNTSSALSNLKPVLKSSPEWLHELNVFNAMILVRRDMDANRKNSPEEQDETRQFVLRMVNRIDKEIATDVAFQILEQDLMREGKYLDDLRLTLRHIEIERRSNGAHAAEEINRIKQAFIQSIWDHRDKGRPGAKITRLFANTRGSTSRTHSTGH